jgi:hypothetical protein
MTVTVVLVLVVVTTIVIVDVLGARAVGVGALDVACRCMAHAARVARASMRPIRSR